MKNFISVEFKSPEGIIKISWFNFISTWTRIQIGSKTKQASIHNLKYKVECVLF